MRRIIIIGCGPAGMAAAIAAAREGADVTVLDKMKVPGKKLLMTGSGRCNLSNTDPDIALRYHSSSGDAAAFARAVFSQEPPSGTLQFFEQIGLPTTSLDGWVYPVTRPSAPVLSVLRLEMERLKVRTKYNCPADTVRRDPESGLFSVVTGGWEMKADRVILCGGSCAYPETGSDGSCYRLAASLGHRIIRPLPALTALHSNDPSLAGAFGARTRGTVRLRIRDRQKESVSDPSSGEIQWNRDGISGICVFALSGAAARALDQGRKVEALLDLVPEMEEQALAGYIKSLMANEQDRLLQRLGGIVHEKILRIILAKSGKDPDAAKLASMMKSFVVPVDQVRGFESAQTVTGGVDISQVDPLTMMSGSVEGLYFAGEILDLDGPCGGYQLQLAWSTGALAGKRSAQ